jgi:ribosome-associated protein
MTASLRGAIQAALDRKAVNMKVLEVGGLCSFTDFFLICSGTSTRHNQAICDAIAEHLKKAGMIPTHMEGYAQAEWILLDYLNFVVHIFIEPRRAFYDLERLWSKAPRIPLPE